MKEQGGRVRKAKNDEGQAKEGKKKRQLVKGGYAAVPSWKEKTEPGGGGMG